MDVESRIIEGRELVSQLFAADLVPIERSSLPESPGLYAIWDAALEPPECLRAGRAEGAQGLRQRLYQNHLMGQQTGNLRAQLVRYGVCEGMMEAKQWIRERARCRFLVILNKETLHWGEHFVLAVLRPRYCD